METPLAARKGREGLRTALAPGCRPRTVSAAAAAVAGDELCCPKEAKRKRSGHGNG